MKLSASVFLFAIFVLLNFACNKQPGPTTNGAKSSPAPTATPDPFAAVRGTFAKECHVCHGPEGKGGPVKLEDGTRLRVPNLREGHALHHPDSDFRKQITQGGDGMPAFKDKFSQQQIEELIRFIRHEFQGGMTPPSEPVKSPTKDMKMD
jgi:mono/diheme cytochrome c family protein